MTCLATADSLTTKMFVASDARLAANDNFFAIVSSCDSLGDITSKSDIGTYSYNASGSGSVRPHAVASIATCSGCTVNGAANPSYTYDANGNMTAGAGRTVTVNSFNMAASIAQGTTTIALYYDSEHNRFAQSATIGSTTTPIYYLNDPVSGAMEEATIVSSTTTTWRDFILADGHMVAQRYAPYGGSVAMSYFVGDHLTSPSSLTDGSGAVSERDGFDSWGMRRCANGTAGCLTGSATTRGFTGHEEMDAIGLVNMNARIYDPQVGRFMTADSIIPNALDGQSYDRYSYVNNGPLSATDPTGHEIETVEVIAQRMKQNDGSDKSGSVTDFLEGTGSMGGGGFGGEGGGADPSDKNKPCGDGTNGTVECVDVIGKRPPDPQPLPKPRPEPIVQFEPLHLSNPRDGSGKQRCDQDTVNQLNTLYDYAGHAQDFAEFAGTMSALTATIPGAQGVAGGVGLGSAVVFVIGTGTQAFAGWEIYNQTGDPTQFRNTLIGAALDAAHVDQPLSGLANGITGNVLGHHHALCGPQ